MLLNVKLIQEGGMICQDMAMATATTYLGNHYELMFQDAWGFDFLGDLEFKSLNYKEYETFYSYNQLKQDEIKSIYKTQLGRRINAGNINEIKYLADNHGIKVETHICDTAESYVNEIIQQLSQGYPVDMWYDQYFMPWTKSSRKIAPLRYQGYLMIIGYDIQEKAFHCIDIHGTRSKEILPLHVFKEFLNMHQRYTYTTYRFTNARKVLVLEEYIEHTLKRVMGETISSPNIFEQMRKTARYIKNSFDFEEEIKLSIICKGKLAAPTHIMCIKSLIEVARMRNLYALTLNYIGSENNNTTLIGLSKEFNLYATKWQIIVSILVKAFYNKQYSELPQLVASHIENIADEEEKMIDKLNTAKYATTSTKTLIKKKNKQDLRTSSMYNLVPYMNNKGIRINELDFRTPNFDGVGNFYLFNDRPYKNIVQCNQVSFQLCLEAGENDNVICQGQYLEVLEKQYIGLAILGACDSGAFYGKIEVDYEDGSKKEYIFGFGEWRFKKCEFKEEIAMQCERIYLNSNTNKEDAYIFYKIIYLDYDGKVKKIKLPTCPNIHIFALTFMN